MTDGKVTPRSPRAVGKTNVRDSSAPFVGRTADLAAIAACYERGARLVTITGPGGMGKTRLAIRFARAEAEAHEDHGGGGAWFVDLTEARSAPDLARAIAAALGIRLTDDDEEVSVTRELARVLARRGGMLIVLDNFEHLTESGAKIVDELLATAGRVRFLVTSRVALELAGEQIWPLGPLSDDDGVSLFLRRSLQVRPDLEAQTDFLPAVSEIVRALEGMPLAIELAAARMAVLSPRQLSERLARPLELLEARRDVGRHTSVRRTVRDSVQLLPSRERAAFAACAVFRGGFTLEAAVAVLDPERGLASIEALARHSLLRRVANPELSGALRFSFFETIREVAAEMLAEDGGREAVARRHAAFFAALAEELGPEAAIKGAGTAFLRLGLELENMLSAFAHAVRSESKDAARARAIALGLEPLLSARGSSRLRLGLLDQAIACARAAPHPDEGGLADLLLARGSTKRELGDMAAARVDLEEALALAEHAGRPTQAALAHARIGAIIEFAGETRHAHERYQRALGLLERAPDDEARALEEAEVHMLVAHAHRREGGLVQAEAATKMAIDRYRRLGHGEGLAGALYEAAVVAMFQGRREVSLGRFDEGLGAARKVDARAVAGALTTARGSLLQEMGALDEAITHHAEAARLFRELGSRYRETSALYYLATAYFERGDRSEAERFLAQALELVRGLGSPRYEALIEGARAVVFRSLGDGGASAESFTRAERAQAACATEPALGATLAIHRLTISIPDADEEAGPAAVREAKRLAEAHPSDDSRFAFRVLTALVHPAPAKARAALVVWDDAVAFRAPHATEAVDLARRAAPRRILRLLCARRVEAPGEPVPVEEIVAAGWPGERIAAQAALNRAYVALTTLRKLGLRDVLQSGEGGYWLDPSIPLRDPTQAQEPSLSSD